MKIHTPNPTVTLTISEIEDIVEQHLQSKIPEKRIGNLVGSDLRSLVPVGQRVRLTGSLTFELYSKDPA